jgi:hypothetical protein
MRIMHKTAIFIISTILFVLLVAYIESNILLIADRWVATFVGTILLCIYLMCFILANDKTMWMKF